MAKVVQLREDMNNQKRGNSKEDNGKIVSGADGSFVSWTKVPHWIGECLWYIFLIDFALYQINRNINTLDISINTLVVVTYTKAPPNSGPDGKMQQREDFKSTCCAVQNFLLSMWSEGIGTKWTDGPIQRTDEFAKICNIDLEKEKVAGVIWYGFARGGLNRAQAKFRTKGVEEVLDVLP